MKRLRRELVFAVLGVTLLGWFVLLRPTTLGGPTTYLWVGGASMDPTLLPGDLAIVRQQPGYVRGEIVAFRIGDEDPGAGKVVIHRIVEVTRGGSYLMQGDNASAPDRWRPTEADIVGALWLRVPGGGRVVGWFLTPVAWAALAALAAFLAMLGKGRREAGDGVGRPEGRVFVGHPVPAPAAVRSRVTSLDARRVQEPGSKSWLADRPPSGFAAAFERHLEHECLRLSIRATAEAGRIRLEAAAAATRIRLEAEASAARIRVEGERDRRLALELAAAVVAQAHERRRLLADQVARAGSRLGQRRILGDPQSRFARSGRGPS